MSDNKMYNVKNRSAGMVVYKIPEDGIRREFAPGEMKKIADWELEKLTYITGGRELMANFLQVQSAEALDNLGIQVEPEYNLSEQDIVKLLSEGSLDEFLDCLDFAPTGVIDLIKQISVALPLNDFDKRQALKDKTGFNVSDALKHIEEEKVEDKKETAETGSKIRRVEKTAPTGRRVTPKATTIASEIKTDKE